MGAPAPTFLQAARRLRNIDPAVYDEFVKAFVTYTQDTFMQVLGAAPDQLQAVQGRIQNANFVLNTLKQAQQPTP